MIIQSKPSFVIRRTAQSKHKMYDIILRFEFVRIGEGPTIHAPQELLGDIA